MGLEVDPVKTAIGETLKVKSIAWKYEREHRLITSPRFCVRQQIQSDQYADFIPFKRKWVKQVDIGVRASQGEIQSMKEFLTKEYSNVQFRRAIFHSADYALEYKPI